MICMPSVKNSVQRLRDNGVDPTICSVHAYTLIFGIMVNHHNVSNLESVNSGSSDKTARMCRHAPEPLLVTSVIKAVLM